MNATHASARRRQLLAAVSVLGVSLGMAGAAHADPTTTAKIMSPTADQSSIKGEQGSIKGEQNSIKGEQSSEKGSPNLLLPAVNQPSVQQKGITGNSDQIKGTTNAWSPAP